LSLAWIRSPEPPSDRPRQGWWKELREGVAVVFGSPVMASMITLVAAYSLAGHVGGDIITVFVYRNLHLTPALFRVLHAVGRLAGSERRRPPDDRGRRRLLRGVLAGPVREPSGPCPRDRGSGLKGAFLLQDPAGHGHGGSVGGVHAPIAEPAGAQRARLRVRG